MPPRSHDSIKVNILKLATFLNVRVLAPFVAHPDLPQNTAGSRIPV
jgi:hypothetical protein